MKKPGLQCINTTRNFPNPLSFCVMPDDYQPVWIALNALSPLDYSRLKCVPKLISVRSKRVIICKIYFDKKQTCEFKIHSTYDAGDLLIWSSTWQWWQKLVISYGWESLSKFIIGNIRLLISISAIEAKWIGKKSPLQLQVKNTFYIRINLVSQCLIVIAHQGKWKTLFKAKSIGMEKTLFKAWSYSKQCFQFWRCP